MSFDNVLKAIGLYNDTIIVSGTGGKERALRRINRVGRESITFTETLFVRNLYHTVSRSHLMKTISERDTVVHDQDLRITKEDIKLLKYIVRSFLICILSDNIAINTII